MKIDTEFLVYSDSKGRDPDSFSPTLKKYNQYLWSKKLPCGTIFELQTCLLYTSPSPRDPE